MISSLRVLSDASEEKFAGAKTSSADNCVETRKVSSKECWVVAVGKLLIAVTYVRPRLGARETRFPVDENHDRPRRSSDASLLLPIIGAVVLSVDVSAGSVTAATTSELTCASAAGLNDCPR